jgi:hypothetical protein
MSRIFINDMEQLVVSCPYEDREIVKQAGAKWDNNTKMWIVAFNQNSIEFLIDNLPDVFIDESVEKKIVEQVERENKLKKIRAMAKVDHPVQLRVPGLNGSPYNYQKLGVMFALTNGQGVLIADEMGLGKDQPVDSKVLTKNGWKRIGDIQIGDEVYSRDGKLYPVTGVYPQGHKEIVKVEFSDKTYAECGWEHLWSVKNDEDEGWQVLTTQEISKKFDGKDWFIPITQPIEFKEKDFECHLYLKGVTLANTDVECSSEDLFSSIEQRADLLAGLLDTKGKLKKSFVTYETSTEQLANNIIHLVQSLGGIAVKKYRPKKDSWVVEINTSFNPFKYSTLRFRWKNPLRLEKKIVNIVKSRHSDAVCISVASPDSTYITESFVVTHNTMQALCTALFLKHRGLAKNALIVMPPSLKYNWAMEIEKWTNEPYVVIDGTPDERLVQWLRTDVFFYVVNYELILEDLFGGRTYKPKKNETEKQKSDREARMLKSNKRAKILSQLRERVWDYIGVDEIHMLKNSTSKRSINMRCLKSKFRMGLTGTPLDGRLEELHSVMEFICPGLLGSKTRFLQRHADTDFFGKVTGYKRISEVREKITPYFIRRLKKDVLKDLPDKLYSNRIIELSPEEMDVYAKLAESGHEATEDATAMVCVIRCKQFCNNPSLLADILEGGEADVDLKTLSSLRKLKSSKLEAFKEILQEVVIENGHKVLIFSQYAEMVKVLMGVFEEMGLKYLCIWGETPKQDRAAYQKIFNEDLSIDVMVGTEAMSTGLNFTSADYVINYDDNWAPAFMAQREDRCHRIGQKSVVNVINFICKGTIEERIRSVLYQKSKISAQALGDELEDFVLKRLGPQEVAKLL